MNVYEIVTNQIISQLEQGIIPWQKPWTGTKEGAYSRTTGKAYSIINQLLLGKPGEYITFNQVKEAGGHIRKGEKASIVVFFKFFPHETGKFITDDKGTHKEIVSIPMLRYYSVFHINQCDGIAPKYKPEEVGGFDPIAEAESIVDNYTAKQNIPIHYIGADLACYCPSGDYIQMPKREQFNSAEGFYSTLFHEMTHSTGHKDRLNRISHNAYFGNSEYSKEELVAEIGSSFLMHKAKLNSEKELKNSTAYIQSWLAALRNDSKMIVSAASKAEKAVDFILANNT